ncbi:MAG TPA: MFS transporter [Blastocatellia bacterium]|nr:MFS transporter [Blastocatellia bacterium]
MTTTFEQLGFREVLQIKAVQRLWVAQVVSVFGDFLALFAAISHVTFNLHASPMQIAAISIAFLIPIALIGPVAGVFVDRWNIKRTMIASDLIRAALVLLLVFTQSLGWIYVTLFLMGAVSTFFLPAQVITIRAIAPPEGLISVNALMHQAVQLVRIISPTLAGVIVGRFGATPGYLIDSVSFLISAAMISTLLIAREPAVPAKDRHPINAVTNDLLASVKFIFTHATLTLAILGMMAGIFAISCFASLTAVYVRDELKSSEIVFGTINSLIGIGMIVGTLAINRIAKQWPKNHLVLGGLLAMGVFILLTGAVKNIPAAAIGMFGVGLGVVFVMVSAQTMIQVHTPVEMMGRVSSSVWALLSVAQLPGLVFSGTMTEQIGITYVFYATAVMLVLMTIYGYFSLPQGQAKTTMSASSD